MNLLIRWTAEAEETFAKIVEYLEEKWSENQIRKFVRSVNNIIKQIQKFPRMFEKSASNPNVRKGFVSKICTLFYEIQDNVVVLLYFWDNRRKPLPS